MALFEYNYTHSDFDVGQLAQEVTSSTITVALDNITSQENDISIYFKAELSSGEWTTLSGVVSAHTRDPAYDPPVLVTAGLDDEGVAVPDAASPVTPDGETHTIQSNMANITGNKLINWTMHYTLGADTSISERFVVPSGKTASIEFVQGYSSAVAFSAELNWYRDVGKRTNPAMNPEHYFIQKVDGNHTAPDNTIKLKNANGFGFADIVLDKRYAFATASGTTFVREVTAKHGPTKTVTLDGNIPTNLQNNDKFAMMDRPIARVGGDASNALMDFEVAPAFRGDGTRFLELIVKNESLTDSGDVFAIVNGWLTPTVGGTIPGGGGDAGVDEDA